MKVEHKKLTIQRAEKIAERWRRALACHGSEIARAEIEYDLLLLGNYIKRKEKKYPELSMKEHQSLYNILKQMKEQSLQKRFAQKRQISFRLRESVRFKLEHLAEKGGVTMTAVVENLILGAKKFEIAIPEEELNE
tara:strand:- start:90 stop:497 length:408 start_codon:yes stop_codon:yes gene_type:complete